MIRATVIEIQGPKEITSVIYERFKDKIPKPFAKDCFQGPWLFLPLLPDSAELDEAMEFAESMGLKPSIFSSRVHYTKKEIDACKFFDAFLPDPLELEGTTSKEYGTTYIGCCPRCGFGGTLSGDVLVDRKFMKKYKMGILEPEIYVSEELKNMIEDSDLTGISFGPKVIDYKGREMPAFYVMKIHHVLPPMRDTTWLEEGWTCSCGQSDIYLRSDVQYEADKLASAEDFNLSLESVNNNRMPVLIVSARAKKFLQEKHVYSFFSPVTIV